VALVPVKQGEPAPKFETLAGGKALKVLFPDRTDVVVLQPEAAELEIDGRKVTSASALIVKRGDQAEVVELAR
jgi:hypothetical protein